MMKKILIALIAALALCACNKKEVHNTYFRVEQGSMDLKFEFFGGTEQYVVYSDYERWTYRITYGEDCEEGWIKVWPYEGEADSRFAIKVFPNEGPSPRDAVVGIVVRDKVMQEIHIEQEGAL